MIEFFRKLGWMARRRTRENQLTAELQFHLEEETEERHAEGLSALDARMAARRELGNLGVVLEDTRSVWGWTLLEQLGQYLRFAARTIRRNPAFTILAALSLALGLGANTAIYSLMDALLLRQLPVHDPGSLAVLKWRVAGRKNIQTSVVHSESGHFHDDPKIGVTATIFPYPAFDLLSRSNSVFSVLFAYRPAEQLTVMVLRQAEIASGEYVSGDYFGGLGITPAAGRLIVGDDDRAGAAGVVVLSYGFAQRRFGDPASAAGQPLRIDNAPFTVIGVSPPGFFGVDPAQAPDVFLPLHADLLLHPQRDPGPVGRYLDEHYYWTEMMGRLRPGVTIAQAQAALAPVFNSWVAGTATTDAERANLPAFLLQDGAAGLDNLRRTYSEPLYILLAMVALILAIACANIANLLLARAASRRREMAVRLSMGAGRWRVIRQLLTETLLLALLGGAGGMLFAIWGTRFLTQVLGAGTDAFPLHAEWNTTVLAAAWLLTMATGVLFGLAPALQATRVDPIAAIKQIRTGGPRSSARLGFSFGGMLVVSQMAICLLLLVGAGLFVRTLSNLHSLDAGFQPGNVLLFQVNARQAGHRDPEILSFYRDLEKRLAAIPGVRSASLANSPLIGDGAWGWPVVPAGKERPENAPTGHGSGFARSATHVLGTGPGFFSTMRIPLIAGREFDEHDRPGTPPVAIVNEAWVKANLDGKNPVGQRVASFGMNKTSREIEIVGLARNARYDDLTGDFPAVVYLPVEQGLDVPVDEMTFFLRVAGNPLGYAGAVREIVRQADARIPVAGLATQAAQIEGEMVSETLFARLCTAFAMLALTIACVGLYATTSYAVARRTREIGIRMALGASKLVESLLFGVKPGDPLALTAACAILLGAAAAAGYLPARKASRIDPMTAVRYE